MNEFSGYTDPFNGQSIAGFLEPIVTGAYVPTSPEDTSQYVNNHTLQQAGFAPLGGSTASIGNLASGGFNTSSLYGLAAQDPFGQGIQGLSQLWADQYLGATSSQQQLPNLYSSWDPNLNIGTNFLNNAISAGLI